MDHENNKRAPEERRYNGPDILGCGATPLPTGLQNINSEYHRYDAHQHNVHQRAMSAL